MKTILMVGAALVMMSGVAMAQTPPPVGGPPPPPPPPAMQGDQNQTQPGAGAPADQQQGQPGRRFDRRDGEARQQWREQWRQAMRERMQRYGFDGREGAGRFGYRDGQDGGSRFAYRDGRDGPGRFGPTQRFERPSPAPGKGARFVFAQGQGGPRIDIKCAEDDSTRACAEALAPIIAQLLANQPARPNPLPGGPGAPPR